MDALDSAPGSGCSPQVVTDGAIESIALPAAAAMAYAKVFTTREDQSIAPSNDELDLVALALSLHLPIYGVRSAEEAQTRISEPELMEGMFWGGAARFESRHRAGVMFRLSVRKDDLERAMLELLGSKNREDPLAVVGKN